MRALLLCLVLASCASVPQSRPEREGTVTRATVEREIDQAFRRSEWTDQERLAFRLSVVAHGMDLASSIMSPSCPETSPFLPEYPSNAQLVAVKLVALSFEWWLYSSPKIHNAHWYGYTSAAIHAAVAIKNSRLDCFGR